MIRVCMSCMRDRCIPDKPRCQPCHTSWEKRQNAALASRLVAAVDELDTTGRDQ